MSFGVVFSERMVRLGISLMLVGGLVFGCRSAPEGTTPAPGEDAVSADYPEADALRARADELPAERADEAARLYIEAREALLEKWVQRQAYQVLDPAKALAGAVEKGWYQKLDPEVQAVLWRTHVGRGQALRRMRRFRHLLVEMPLSYPSPSECPPDLQERCRQHLVDIQDSFPGLVTRTEDDAFEMNVAATIAAGDEGSAMVQDLAARLADKKASMVALDVVVDEVETKGKRRVLVRRGNAGSELRIPLAAGAPAVVRPGDRVLVAADFDRASASTRLRLTDAVVIWSKAGDRYRYLYGVDLGGLLQ